MTQQPNSGDQNTYSSNASDVSTNSDSAMTTLPIGDRRSIAAGQRTTGSSLGGSLQRPAKMAHYQHAYGKQSTASARSPSSDAASHHRHNNNNVTIDAATGCPLDAAATAMASLSSVSTASQGAFWAIVTIMFGLTLGNLALTCSIIGVLRLGHGIGHMELVPEAHTIKFTGATELDRVYKRDGRIEGFADVPVSITGDNGAVEIALMRPNTAHPHSSVRLANNGTMLRGFAALDVRSPVDGAPIFSTHRPHYTMPGGGYNLHAKVVSTGRLTAAIDQPLHVNHTRGRVVLRGTEGVRLSGAHITLAADQNVWLHSANGTMSLQAAHGVYVDVRSMPVIGEHGVKVDQAGGARHYKLCVCMPQGRLFRVPVAVASSTGGHAAKGLCSHFSEQTNPCA